MFAEDDSDGDFLTKTAPRRDCPCCGLSMRHTGQVVVHGVETNGEELVQMVDMYACSGECSSLNIDSGEHRPFYCGYADEEQSREMLPAELRAFEDAHNWPEAPESLEVRARCHGHGGPA